MYPRQEKMYYILSVSVKNIFFFEITLTIKKRTILIGASQKYFETFSDAHEKGLAKLQAIGVFTPYDLAVLTIGWDDPHTTTEQPTTSTSTTEIIIVADTKDSTKFFFLSHQPSSFRIPPLDKKEKQKTQMERILGRKERRCLLKKTKQ